jgi:hypothetical protein
MLLLSSGSSPGYNDLFGQDSGRTSSFGLGKRPMECGRCASPRSPFSSSARSADVVPYLVLVPIHAKAPPLRPTHKGLAVQETIARAPEEPTRLAVCQAEAPPVGFVEVTMLPWLSVATQSEAEGHERSSIAPAGSTAFATSLGQAVVPPVGWFDVTMLPLKSTATHSEAEGQETAFICAVPSTRLRALQPETPPVGLLELTTLPCASTATQRDAEAQETLRRPLSTFAVCQAEAPPLGWVDVTTLPLKSAATQSDAEAQDTPLSATWSTFAVCQADAPPAGLVEVITLP